MIFLALSAAFVGFVHSLAPGHWLPVVLMARARRWPLGTAVLGAVTAASGHILISSSLGAASIFIGSRFFTGYEEEIEKYASLLLVVFGLVYALSSFFRHHHCHGHDHHGPNHTRYNRAPFLFLFSLGFSPCVAVVPVLIASSAKGSAAAVLTMLAFSGGVLTSLVGSTLLVSMGTHRVAHRFLDHPIIEHYGDVIAGVSILLMGVGLFFYPI